MRCSSCDHDNRVDRRFCTECGATLSVACPSCAAPIEVGAKFCGGCGARLPTESSVAGAPALTPEHDAASAGERRQLTVLFCDLVGSTALSQQLDAEDLRAVVRAYQEAAAGAIQRHAGHVAQYLGDGLLVYFGYPHAHEDDAERAVRAGLDILTALGRVNGTPALPHGVHLAARVGLHTGAVVIGEMGGGARSEVLALGDTTNIAARVQGAAEPDTVVITAATQRLVAGMFVVEERGPQTLKGVREPVPLYRVVQPSGVRSRLDAATGRLTPFVGRDLELATLVDRWERAAEGEGQNVLVVGEAGVGKSRLVYQLRERLAAVPHTWLECRATPYTEGTPFHPVIDLVQQGLAFAPDDTAAEKVEKLERAVTLARLDPAEAVPLVADFLGLAPPEGYPRLALNPDVQRRKTMELLAAWNLALAEVQPLVLLIEDLHWVDPSSRELFGRLMAQTATARVLLVATARPEFAPPWPARSNLTTLQLARLTKRQAREMIAALAGGSLSAEMVDTLVARADGVPLYVEELTKGVAEPDVARGVDAIPATLADSLMARLDRLSAAKEVAQRAAVLGREFPYALLAVIAEMDEAGLCQGLVRLVEAEILFARGEPPSATYTFKHALVQEAAYGSLLKRTRQQLHRRVVEALVERFPERVAAEPELVAQHAEAAGRSDDAIMHYGRAGEQAWAGSAHEEAIRQLRKAIVLLETRPADAERDARELRLQLMLNDSLVAVRGYSHAEVEAASERAAVLADAAGDAARLGIARTGLAIVYFMRGEVERGRALLAEVLAAAKARGDRQQLFIGHAALSGPEFVQGKFASSLAHCEQAIALYDSEQRHGLARVFNDQAIVAVDYAAWNLFIVGHPDAALGRAREAVALARRINHPFTVAYALWYETVVHWLRQDLAAQRERAAEVISLSEAQGFPVWLGLGRAYHAAARVMQGDPYALPEIMEGLALAAETRQRFGIPALFLLLADAQQAGRQIDAAQGSVATGLAVAAQTGQPFFDADLHRLDGDLLLASGGAADEAATLYHRALDIAREQGARSFELRAATSLARLLHDQSKRAEARDLLAPVYGWFTDGFDTGDLIEAKALLDEL
jgi:class 3 adenylate cyclase/tetratricopeptide (TPR) repeat protein